MWGLPACCSNANRGTSVYSRASASDIFALCDFVSGKIADLLAAQRVIQTVLRNVSKQGKSIIKRKSRDQE